MSILKYRVSHSNIYGRYLVADRDILAGEVIIREEPLIVGPMNFENRFVCFACMKSIFNTRFVCSQCNIAPLCGELCGKWQTFHSSEECELFVKHAHLMQNNLHRIIDILMHLRLWLIRKTNPKLWNEISQMEAHLIQRRERPVWESIKLKVIKCFEDFNIIPRNDQDSSELIQQISGILDVNTFEIRSNSDISESPLRGLYLEPSLMAHKCIANTHLTVDDDFRMVIYASVPIPKDEMICFNYTSPFMGYAERQTFLLQGKYFKCSCTLCQDVTEGGSNISTIFCPKCKKGHMTMNNALEDDPYSRFTKWKCQNCDKILSGCLVKSAVNISTNLVNTSGEQDIPKMESLMKKLSLSLHPNHFVMLSLKQKLLGAYKIEVMSRYIEKNYLQRMIELGHELLDVINVVEPGISRLKGILLYEMHLPMVSLANLEYLHHEISLNDLLTKLEEARSFLKKSLTIMIIEPPTSPEGLLSKEAFRKLKQLNDSIKDIQCLNKTN